MKQRLGIAAALLGFPKLLILDEPTNGLDPAGIQEMRELICSLPERFGMTVVVSSHLLSEIDQIADVVGIIREGNWSFRTASQCCTPAAAHELLLRTTDNKAAAALLASQGLPCRQEGDYLTLSMLKDPQAARLSRLLCQNGLDLIRMEERQTSLEDIFLELTGGKEASL